MKGIKCNYTIDDLCGPEDFAHTWFVLMDNVAAGYRNKKWSFRMLHRLSGLGRMPNLLCVRWVCGFIPKEKYKDQKSVWQMSEMWTKLGALA